MKMVNINQMVLLHKKLKQNGNKQMVNGGINIKMVLILRMILKQFKDKHITLMEMVIW